MSTDVTHCIVCGSEGFELFTDIKDHWYESPGKWSLIRCTNAKCGFGWIAPFPDRKILTSAYSRYYTHKNTKKSENGLVAFLGYFLKYINDFIGLTAKRIEREEMYIGHFQPGVLLEIGCGSGERLRRFADRGWKVEGQEVDRNAIAVASCRVNCHIHSGPVEQLELPESHYDVIVMNHVLEHVESPLDLLQRCSKLLKPGGVFVCAVPNLNGSSAKEFGPLWWGIDLPRHLYHFSPGNLQSLASEAGMPGCTVKTSIYNHESWLVGSYFLTHRAAGRLSGGQSLHWSHRLLCLLRQYLILMRPGESLESGDECILQWHKPF